MAELQIELKLSFQIPQNGLSINNLLYQLRKFMAKLFFAILEAIFSAVEQRVIEALKASFPGRYVRNGLRRKPRQIRTAYGLFGYRVGRVLDKETKKTFSPLWQAIGLPAYRRTMEESTEGGMGLVCHLSYRKSVKEIDRVLGTEMSKSTLHREVQRFGQQICQWPDMKQIPYRYLMVDGTKVRLQETDEKGHGKKVEMRWALASVGEKHKFDLVGIWIDQTWEQIRWDLGRRLKYSNLEVLFSDGGAGIEEHLLDPGMLHQRCTWHGKRDFAYILYADRLKTKQQEYFKLKLNSIPAMNLTQAGLEQLSPEDFPKVQTLAEKTKQGFTELMEALPKHTYPKARAYIRNLATDVATFFDFWFANKVWIPLNTNAIESAFSQVKNRIWAVGRRWSEPGLLNWLKVVVQKVFYPDSWNKLWEEYLSLDPQLKINLLEVRYRWA
jgi:transposase-like protein